MNLDRSDYDRDPECRASFERWAAKLTDEAAKRESLLTRVSSGGYKHPAIDQLWLGWAACWVEIHEEVRTP